MIKKLKYQKVLQRIVSIFILLLSFVNLFAQKQIQFNGKTIDIEGTLIATHQYLNDGKADGTKEIYSYRDTDLNILTITEINTDKYNTYSSIFIYYVNLNKLNKSLCYVTTKTNTMYKQPDMYVVILGLKEGFKIQVKSTNRGYADWTKTMDPIAQIYFTDKAEAEIYLEEMLK